MKKIGLIAMVVICAAMWCMPSAAQKIQYVAGKSTRGDFNGDGKKETATLMINKDISHWDDEGYDMSNLNAYITFSDKRIPNIFVKMCIGGQPRNLGDINGDGKDEIGMQPQWVTSAWQSYCVWTLKHGEWIESVPSFTVYVGNDIDFDKNPPVKKLGKGKVRIYYNQWENEDIVTKSKVVTAK